jgi:hypothetical protein
VLLDLEAVWCHWCHVMDAQTFADPKVIALIQSHYLAVNVDQDSRPDISDRYEDYGWRASFLGEKIRRHDGGADENLSFRFKNSFAKQTAVHRIGPLARRWRSHSKPVFSFSEAAPSFSSNSHVYQLSARLASV